MTSREAIDFYDSPTLKQCGRSDLEDAVVFVREWLKRVPEDLHDLPVIELGCGLGAMRAVSPRHVGLDLSLRAIASCEGLRAAACDMEAAPIRHDSAALVFSWAAMEHVPRPERVLDEITRILAPGGMAVLNPAWHCRPWAAEGLEFRPYSELAIGQKIRKSLIPVRNSLALRAPFEALRRLRVERRLSSGQPLPLEYTRLNPNLETYVGTDCDAFTSLDPHAVTAWFLSRGWVSLSHETRKSRLLARHEPVVVQKPRKA